VEAMREPELALAGPPVRAELSIRLPSAEALQDDELVAFSNEGLDASVPVQLGQKPDPV
jgi:hypothetical protein